MIQEAGKLVNERFLIIISTQVGNDFLQLYKQEKRVEPILDAFSGKPENWPRVPLLIQGDTVCFHFHSEAFGSFWGYR